MAIPSVPVVPNPYSASFSNDAYTFTVWMAAAAPMFDAATTQVNQALVQSLLGVTGTSTTSYLIGAGAKTFTTQTGLGFPIGMPVKITDVSNVSNYMKGTITGYNSSTGALNATIATVNGSGTIANWQIAFDVPSGSSGYVPVGGLVPFKNLGSSFTDNGTTWLKTGVIASSATYPLAPSVTIPDGSTWVSRTGISNGGYAGVSACNGSGTIIQFTSNLSTSAYVVSTDNGTTYSNASLPVAGLYYPVWCGTFFLAVNPSVTTTFYTSPTGLTGTWTARTVPTVPSGGQYLNAVYGASGCILTTNTTTGYITTDGITYTSIMLPVSSLVGVYGNGMYLFHVGGGTTVYRTLDAGVSFLASTSLAIPSIGFSDIYSNLTYGNGIFLSVGAGGKIISTADGSSFNSYYPVNLSPSNPPRVVFGNGVFVVFPDGGTTIWYSSDSGLTWAVKTSFFSTSADWTNSGVFTGTVFSGHFGGAGYATQSVSGTYTDTSRALFADSPANTRPYYMRVA